MEIQIKSHSALSGQTSYTDVLLPPFPESEGVQAPILRSWTEQLVPRTSAESVESEQQVDEFALTEEQVISISDALRVARITPSSGSFNMFSTCDGWTTKLTLDAYDSKVVLEWFCDPPPEWIGVGELCDNINRMVFTLKQQRD